MNDTVTKAQNTFLAIVKIHHYEVCVRKKGKFVFLVSS